MLYVYIGCLTFGAAYSLLSLIFGGHGAEHGAVEHGDLPSPFNPLVIASAITTFGAVGLIAKLGFKLGDLMSILWALGFAGVVGAIIFFGIVKLMYASQSDSTFSQSDLIGIEAEVTTPIQRNGLGEIVCSINGIRYNLTAKNSRNEMLARGDRVIIKEVAGNVADVSRRISIDDINIIEDCKTESKKQKEQGF